MGLRAFFEDDEGFDELACDFVLFADRDCGVYRRMLAEDGFDFLRVDVEAADDDDVGRTVYDFYVSVLVYAHDRRRC